jgi:thiamine-phosphate pyrophosphorylase
MANSPQRGASIRSRPRLYLVTPPVAEPGAHADALAVALAAADIAAVLLRLAPADDRTLINRAKALASVVQQRDVALLIDGRHDLVARAGADGAHLSGVTALSEAIETLKPDRIAGCGGLASRHDAMLAGEAGADYVMFGEPDETGHRPARDSVIERVAWWAEVFEVPCVGYAGSLSEVVSLVAARADFVALGDWVFRGARGPAAAVVEAAQRVAVGEAVE